VWDVLPEGTPLIGGTVAGFIIPQGCFVRGATALAVSYPNMDVAVGIGRNTKRNPKKAAKECAEMIKRGLRGSRYENKFLINCISGPIIPRIPIFGRVNVVKSKLLGTLITYFGLPLFSYLGYGVGKEGDIVDELALSLPEYYVIGGSTMDDGGMFSCYQFLRDEIHTNSIVAGAGAIDLPIFLKGLIVAQPTDKTFEITCTTFDNSVITKINNKPAKEEFLRILDLYEQQYMDLKPFYYKTSDYFPITFKDNREYTSGVGGFYGSNIILGYKARGRNVRLLSVTGKEMVNSINHIFRNRVDFPFVLSFSSFSYLFILGDKTFEMKDMIDRKLKDVPYLIVYSVNENIGFPEKSIVNRVYSINVISLIRQNESD